MGKDEFVIRRTEIISKMLDSPDRFGLYDTTVCFAELDDIYDELTKYDPWPKSGAQYLRDKLKKEKP